MGPVSSYRLRYKETDATDQTASTAGDPSTGWVTTTASITTTMAEITMLTNGTAYHVQVSANDGQTRSGNGWGDWSSSQTGTPTATVTRTTVTLISNTGQGNRATLATGSNAWAQQLTTGSSTGGYTLTSIELRFGAAIPSGVVSQVRAELWSDSSGSPGTKEADLTVPSSIPAGVVSFAAPASTTLTASTNYHVVFYQTGSGAGIGVSRTTNSALDSGDGGRLEPRKRQSGGTTGRRARSRRGRHFRQ